MGPVKRHIQGAPVNPSPRIKPTELEAGEIKNTWITTLLLLLLLLAASVMQ
jgi:hypothetical protein